MSDRAPTKSLSSLRTGGKLASIVPETFEDVQRIANMAVSAGLGSYDWRDTPEQRMAKATAAILHGLEVGLSPMQALAGIAVINGKTTLFGDVLTAVLWAHGFKVKKWIDGDGDARIARARITRPDGEVIEDQFSVQQAKQARLWDSRETVKKKSKSGDEYFAPNDSAWHRFPDDMLGWKALGRCVRAGASDATRGMMIREDMENPMVDITPAAPSAIADIDEIPDIPEPAKEPTTEAAQPADIAKQQPDTEPDTLADPEGALTALREALSGETDDVIRMEIWDSYGSVIERMSDTDRRRAEAIFEGRER